MMIVILADTIDRGLVYCDVHAIRPKDSRIFSPLSPQGSEGLRFTADDEIRDIITVDTVRARTLRAIVARCVAKAPTKPKVTHG